VFRNVKDFGAKGDGKTDDTAAINRAISEGNRCAENCNSTSVKAALIYFPAGTYLVSGTIVALYNSQLIGNPNNRPTILAAPSFVGLGVISTDPYYTDRSTPDGGGVNWYINQSNFLRQIRNFIIDIRATTVQYPAGLHYQVAQATSLENIDFYQSTDPKTTQQGIFSENGSGGFMSDLVFHAGNFGLYGGNQQFTVRNLKFIDCNTAIQIIWDWAWTWKSLDISGGKVGISLLGENGKRETGSVFITDSRFTNVPVAILTSTVIEGTGKGNTLITLDNVVFSSTPIAVQDNAQKTILAGGTQTISSWTLGNYYNSANPNGTFGPASIGRPTIPSLLGGPNGGYFEKSRPQYENIPVSGFLNIKTVGAQGDGATDDTVAINAALASEAGKRIIYFPAGSYIVTDTIKIPPGTKIVGECWSQIMGKGKLFANMNAPYVMVQVGNRGDTGDVEISDMLFTATGATAGIILMEWNILASSPGSAGLWDSHFRIGGAAGSGLQVKDCPIRSGLVKSSCIAGSMLLHLTSQSSMYAENMWAWVADHDLDDPANTQVDIYVARGILIESQGPSWFYGTASEHSVLYQYELYAAQNIYMAMIQTETPYFQPSPQAPAPFASTLGQFSGDFDFRDCPNGNDTAGCATSWGLRVVSCTNVVIGGAGLYSWFQNYNQNCLATQNCQNGIVSTVINNGFWFYNLITIGAVQMISPTGSSI
ncbi:beta-1,3-glucanase, partial [Tricladium varicosporioides]